MITPMAALYDRMMNGVEVAGLMAWRTELISELSGEVLEIGAGTGRNTSLYPPSVTRLVLTEPDRNMRARLRRDAAPDGPRVEVLDAGADQLPFPDGSFDAVVSTLVLCSVPDQSTVLAEIRRVLRSEGRLVFLEHVAAADGTSRRVWQGRVEPVWRRIAGNCHLTRATEDAIGAAGFEVGGVQYASMRKAPSFVRPTIRGTATPLPA